MLVGGRMEDDRWMIGLEYLIQAGFITDGADERDDGSLGTVLVAQLGLQLVGAVLVNVKDEQTAGLVAHDLAAQLAADGTAAAGNQHDLIVQVLGDLGVVQLDLVAGKEVGGVQLTETGGYGVAVLVHGLGVRQHAHPAVGGVAEVDDLGEAVTF